MNLHEYQAKEILNSFGVRIQRGYVADNVVSASSFAERLSKETGTSFFIIKAQVHAGGRGKGGGIKLAKNLEEVKLHASNILGMNLITPQTSSLGKKVNQILIAEDVYYPGESEINEIYVSILLNRITSKNMIVYSTEGGMDIEEVAEKTPDKIVKAWVKDDDYPLSNAIDTIVDSLDLSSFDEAKEIFRKIFKCYTESDCNLLEINPLVLTEEDKIIALDAKVDIDSNALFRQDLISTFHDKSEEDPLELKASEYGLNYIKLDGNVGCMVNGAGLAMATMDIVKHYGGEPANFLDVGGAANVETIKNGFKIILSDPNVKSILINIFGGIVRCDRVANGVIQAVKELNLNVGVVVRLQGTNATQAKKILDESDIDLISAETIDEAAKKAVGMVI